MEPSFPIVIQFSDWELAAFADRDEFFSRSGCEEVDFLDDLVRIIDSEGKSFGYQQATQTFLLMNQDRISVVDLESLLREHVRRKAGSQSEEPMRQFPRENYRAAVTFCFDVVRALDS